MTSSAPFIVTAELPPDVLSWADGLRRAHFPPERNWLEAHVTLFHAFAPSLREELRTVLRDHAAAHPPQDAWITGLMNLGKGTALAIRSPGMVAIREEIADRFHGALTAQDRHPIRLHITVQNKGRSRQSSAQRCKSAASALPGSVCTSTATLIGSASEPFHFAATRGVDRIDSSP